MADRKVIFYRNHFLDFFNRQNEKVKKKIAQTLVWIQTIDRLPVSIMRNIEGTEGLFEIRVIFGGNIFRIFCCFDGDELVVLFNAFQKKTQKTPPGEIERAKKLMKEYFDNKK